MNYRHIFHAGNFADVFKHCLLILLTQSLSKKETPFCYLDTHAGIGLYDLTSPEAQKTKEYENGVSRILSLEQAPPIIKTFQNIIQNMNAHERTACEAFPHFYPGSPSFVRALLRPQDRMILVELHPEDVKSLKQFFRKDSQTAVHHNDGYQAIKAFLPPKEKRGLILIDPPFEKTDEFQNIIKAMKTAYRKFPTGVYAIWYPIKDQIAVNRFHNQLKGLGFSAIATTNFSCSSIETKPDATPLCKMGMVIVNPPFQFEQEWNALREWLKKNM
ncbi:MAG: 23S rRNA (adenine(2030)-N(6))-methyltransferase RlmJ [Pseudomonadota bacterium]|nr:23S rRNA (adenine(2030)-N(6))-methyltransferase RlmJ [Gammaproteobacteria bacterium]MBU1629232.1 23S rRNA (adenine(2030)-N(6))-methyltransferase RlmJ [Gammaproteobacteria bacterium]MBU1926751.1 23S rRNA (adenine(2030)-N(6))-methyltransferase RlmJ [Gammaproteobacteria bacterium]MBU2546461.1 23S rRNA (adenine(2030)-N(6))-methyltransferase RlmJ [Gammaproteobacteria bacterium]